MSTAERVNKQIKALAANSKFLTSIIQENEIASIKNKMDLLQTAVVDKSTETNKRETHLYLDKEIYFDSMLQLTNFILYNDYPNETECTSKRKYLQTSRCEYQLTKTDLKEIDYFAKELDTIETDLADIRADIVSYKKSYLVYCETLMRFIDQKEVLMSLFLNYYDEYFLQKKDRRESNLDSPSALKKNRHGSESACPYTSHSRNSKAKKSINRKSRLSSVTDQSGYISDTSFFSSISIQQAPSKAQHLPKNLRAAKSTTVYVSSIPTENRFALLNKITKTKS